MRQHAFEENGVLIIHLSPFLIHFYRSMGWEFPLLSRSNPGRYVKDVEVDTDEDEMPACTPPVQLRKEEEPLTARVSRKRNWEGEAEQSQQRDAAAPNRKRTMQELCSRPKQKARNLVLPANSAETGRAAERRNLPSSGEDATARTSERSERRSGLAGSRVSHRIRHFGREWSGGRGSRSYATQLPGIAGKLCSDRDPQFGG
ncbi:hypothetical protein AXG93_3116s1000 [Marchantia polymorpha subsp. ruderalis]|uniref:Uncharacterized protein n=1 Tax=Marchantia polymorpha subsp. ruderalis TaxID=1480154 RepID=A0A176VZE0_MARPO|nr:hypothetical protein AXG93_3116s1000 [Marchantia polymorpha subsp. ruderalis]